MLVDTHTHLQFPDYDADREAVLARAWAAGVTRLVVVGTDLASSRQAVALAARHEGRVFATVGIHPHDAGRLDEDDWAELRALAARRHVVAIGETGLDYYRNHCSPAAQLEAFERQQALALELGLPLVIHCREAHQAVYDALAQGGGFGTRVQMHCFTTHPELLPPFLDRGCWLGTDGPVTYPKADEARAIAAAVPLDRLLLETDCPYLAPQRHRGRRCEPSHVREVAQAVAALRDLPLNQLIAATSANAAAFFGWSDDERDEHGDGRSDEAETSCPEGVGGADPAVGGPDSGRLGR